MGRTAIERASALLAVVLTLALLLAAVPVRATNHEVPGPPSGDGIQPVLIDGNRSCANLAPPGRTWFEVKVDEDGVPNGVYSDGTLAVTIANSNGIYFDWSANLGIDAVLVKGGPDENQFVYDPPTEDTADTKLHAPINPNTGQPYGLSHASFCYDLELQVTKTAQTSFKRTYRWQIEKSANHETLTLATGATGSVDYVVKVSASPVDSDHKVNGTITVYNPAPFAANITGVSDVVSADPAIPASVNCGAPFPITLASKGTLQCTYSASLPGALQTTNTATASTDTPGIGNGSGSAEVNFANATIQEVDKSITVNDSLQGLLGGASASESPKEFKYQRQVGPYATCGKQEIINEASFITNDLGQTGKASRTVTVNVECKLTVIKKLIPANDSGKFNLLIDGVELATNVGDGGTTGPRQVALGAHTVSETAGTSTSLAEYLSRINCNGAESTGTSATVQFAAGDSDKTCTITNTKKGRVTVKKTTNKVVDPTKSIDFRLTGPGLPSGGITLNTSGDQDGVLDFGHILIPGDQYTVCENLVPAGFTSFWMLDGVIVTPYNPDASKTPPEDIGVRCYNFSAQPGQTRAFEIDNSRPGGDPRTIGYWKNWNKCTGGNQATTAAKNGGSAAGFFLVEDLLPQLIGQFNVTGCTQAVKVLSKQDQSGSNRANDAAYELAAQLLAARLNLAAGAKTCAAVQKAVLDGQNLLNTIKFTGSGPYLTTKSTNRTTALSLAATLDKYNNGGLCP